MFKVSLYGRVRRLPALFSVSGRTIARGPASRLRCRYGLTSAKLHIAGDSTARCLGIAPCRSRIGASGCGRHAPPWAALWRRQRNPAVQKHNQKQLRPTRSMSRRPTHHRHCNFRAHSVTQKCYALCTQKCYAPCVDKYDKYSERDSLSAY
jgi:hypothetical protein